VQLSMRRVVHAMINAEFSDGLGQTIPHQEVVFLDTSGCLQKALLKARGLIEFVACSDVSQLKIDQIDKQIPDSPRREIARACKQLLTMKAPHGKRRWGVGITPVIEKMLKNKTCELIDSMYENSELVVHHTKQAGFVEVGFARFVGHLVAVAITVLPSTKKELSRLYYEIWYKRERDKTYEINKSQKAKEKLHRECLKIINNLKKGLPVSSLTLIEPSALGEIQKLHWNASLLNSCKIASISQRRIFITIVNLKKMKDGRSDEESQRLNNLIRDFVEDIEISNYWLDLLNQDFQVYQQTTCLDWCRLKGISQTKMNHLIEELSEFVRSHPEIHLRIALLRLLFPLVEPWILSVLLERKLKKESITRHISTGLKEFKEYLEYGSSDLLETFKQLKEYARPYRKGGC